MKIATQALAGNFRRNPLFLLGFLLFAAFAAYKVAGYVIDDDLPGLSYAAMIFVGLGVVVAILKNWRNGLYAFLAWLLFEDFVRKYLGNNMAIYFAKDFLAAILYLSFFIASRKGREPSFRPPFLIPVLLLVWFGVMQAFNPASPHLAYGALGVKLFFYYIPLLFVGYALLNSEIDLRRFFFINMSLVLVIVLLGIAQSVLGHTFLNPETPAADLRELSTNYRVSPTSGLISYRSTSVFVSTGRYANFLLVSLISVTGFTGYLLLRRRQGRTLAFLTFATVIAGILLASSRGTLLWGLGSLLIIVVAFVWGAPWRQREVLKVFRVIPRAAIGMVLAVALLSFLFPDVLASRLAFYSETLSPNSSTSELRNRSWDYPLENFMGAFSYPRWPYGYGIGTSSLGLGTQYVSRIFETKAAGVGVESGYGTLVVEMGIGGLALWLIMASAIVIASWRVVKKLRGSPWFPVAFAIFWYTFLLLFPMTFNGMQPYEDFVLNAYLWLLLGILFRLPHLSLSSQFAFASPSSHTPRAWVR